jgi:diaminohydroxyphosphoribosylaminopyrimidine deaminase/5-amino-6-(5-phosphoribosylamino)uracil reductase
VPGTALSSGIRRSRLLVLPKRRTTAAEEEEMASPAELVAMRRALALSADHLGTSNPNPCVGAVVLDAAGEVAGEGFTQPVGGDHAEVGALRAAGPRARGGTLVVTLEPCCHVGRSQRCTDAIETAGVARLVYALDDPHQIAAGGAQRLAASGVDVEGGVLAAEAAMVLGPWVTAAARQRPYLTWKYAVTLDGRAAAVDGSSQWITGEAARRDVHRQRLEADAVIAGIGTVLADDPQLTVRDCPAPRQPLRVVVDSDARTPADRRVLDGTAPTLVAVCDDAPPERVAALRSRAQVELLQRRDGSVDLAALLSCLRAHDVFLALLEGGATLAAGFLRLGLVDRLVGYYAPALLGGGAPTVGELGIDSIDRAARLEVVDVTRIGADVRITTVPRNGER